VGRQGDLFAAPPDGLVHRSDFLTPDDERALLAEIARLPFAEARYKAFTAKRRIVSFGAGYDFERNDLAAAPPLPPFLLALRERAAAFAGVPAERLSQSTVTEYRPGTTLGWHRDAPSFGTVVGISLAAPCRMRFRPYPPKPGRVAGFELLLEPRSAYVLRGDARWGWQHHIPPTKALRYSITFRTLRAGTAASGSAVTTGARARNGTR
jgi:alkylated DNA repair dioxygenase AlkB